MRDREGDVIKPIVIIPGVLYGVHCYMSLGKSLCLLSTHLHLLNEKVVGENHLES